MKGYGVVTVAFLAYWAAATAGTSHRNYADEIITRCPRDANVAITLAHETDCSKAYICDRYANKHEIRCSWDARNNQTLHFNLLSLTCDWQFRAGCISCPEDGYPLKLTHEVEDCDKYYECVNLEKIERACPAGTCFSRTCQDCVQNREGGNCD